MWLCGFAVGAAAVYGVIWTKDQYDAHRTLQALKLPEPASNSEVAKLFVPEEKPPVQAEAAAAIPHLPFVPEAKAAPPKVVKTRPLRKQLASKSKPVRKVMMAKSPRRLADNRAVPRILEIRKVNRRPCQRGDLARECYAVR
jgi:hypothetical protein